MQSSQQGKVGARSSAKQVIHVEKLDLNSFQRAAGQTILFNQQENTNTGKNPRWYPQQTLALRTTRGPMWPKTPKASAVGEQKPLNQNSSKPVQPKWQSKQATHGQQASSGHGETSFKWQPFLIVDSFFSRGTCHILSRDPYL